MSPTDRPMFRSGVASGDPESTAMVLWTRIHGNVESVDWHLDDGHATARTGTVRPVDGVVRVVVDDLTPATSYRYHFVADGIRSPEGSTRTLPVDRSDVRIAVVCCSRWPSGDFGLYRAVADADPHLVVHVGDYVYTDGSGGPRGEHDPPWQCRTAEDFERRYGQYRDDPDLQTLHAAAPWVAMWDDHEFGNELWSSGNSRAKTSVHAPESRSVARDAYQRWMPQRPHGNGPTTVDRLLHLGRRADLLLVDTRRAGRERPPGDAAGPALEPNDGEARTLLTDEQWQWLDDTVRSSTADQLLIASAVQMAPLRLAPLPAKAWPPWRWLVNPDQWDGYPSERQRLVEMLTSHDRRDAVVLSGDLHARFEIAPGPGHLREITTPSISAPTFADSVRDATLPVPTAVLEWWLQRCNPHIDHLDLGAHGATIVEVTAAGITSRPITI